MQRDWGLVPALGPHSLFVIQCSAGRSRFLRRPCSTERTEGRWTSCSTKRWDCQEKAETQSLPCGPHAHHRAPAAKHRKGPQVHSDALLGEGPWDLGEP